MGWGDEIISTFLARKAQARHPDKKIVVGDGANVIWSDIFEGNPRISREESPGCLWVRNFKGHRPYISKMTATHYTYDMSFRVEPGEIYLTEEERAFDERDFVYIEPNIKGWLGDNKDWGIANWQSLVDTIPEKFIQGGDGALLAGASRIETPTFRRACGLLSRARLFIGTDGGLHHAAAALGVPAVVIWTGFAPHEVLGYASHTNIHAGTKACGKLYGCPHCKRGARAISVERVAAAVQQRLNERSGGDGITDRRDTSPTREARPLRPHAPA